MYNNNFNSLHFHIHEKIAKHCVFNCFSNIYLKYVNILNRYTTKSVISTFVKN
jgi:hypothetical protein